MCHNKRVKLVSGQQSIPWRISNVYSHSNGPNYIAFYFVDYIHKPLLSNHPFATYLFLISLSSFVLSYFIFLTSSFIPSFLSFMFYSHISSNILPPLHLYNFIVLSFRFLFSILSFFHFSFNLLFNVLSVTHPIYLLLFLLLSVFLANHIPCTQRPATGPYPESGSYVITNFLTTVLKTSLNLASPTSGLHTLRLRYTNEACVISAAFVSSEQHWLIPIKILHERQALEAPRYNVSAILCCLISVRSTFLNQFFSFCILTTRMWWSVCVTDRVGKARFQSVTIMPDIL